MRAVDYDAAYASARSPLFGRDVIATPHPLASLAGLAMLMRSGNAVDAAVAAAMALTVAEPTGCGIGGDAFAIVWDRSELHGLNSSGRSPAAGQGQAQTDDRGGRRRWPIELRTPAENGGEQRCVIDAAGHYTDRVEAIGQQLDAGARYRAETRLEADYAAERLRPNDRSRGLRAEGERRHAVGDGRG
jgi:hypothetical protein